MKAAAWGRGQQIIVAVSMYLGVYGLTDIVVAILFKFDQMCRRG